MNNNSTIREDKVTEIPKTYKYFLYFEIVSIFVFIPLMTSQIYLSVNYFIYIFQQTNYYHYYFVTQRLLPKSYNSDLYSAKKTKDIRYIDNWLDTCLEGYEYNKFLVLNQIKNVELEDITSTINIKDPDFPNLKLNANARNYKFFKFDITKPPLDSSKASDITLNNGVIFTTWKGNKYCRKKLLFDSNYKLLQIIEGSRSCNTTYPNYHTQDCGTYFNFTYRICALLEYATSGLGTAYSNNDTLLNSDDNICPVTKLEILEDKNGELTITPFFKNEVNYKTGYQDNEYYIYFLDYISFENYLSELPGNYDMNSYSNGKVINVQDPLVFGKMDDVNTIIDQQDFQDFYNYTTLENIYYPGFINGSTSGYFYRPYASKPFKVLLGIFMMKAMNVECYTNVYKGKTTDLLGLVRILNVEDLFGFVLTVLVWTFASIFIGFYCGIKVRYSHISQKLNGTMNLNNRKSEEITKWTFKLFWFMVFAVKIVIISQIIGLNTNQISIVNQFIKYNCYDDKVTPTLVEFGAFLSESLSRARNIIYFQIVEFFLESLTLTGYLIIYFKKQRQEIMSRRALELMFKDE